MTSQKQYPASSLFRSSKQLLVSFFAAVLLTASCGDKKPDKNEEPPVVIPPPTRASSFVLLPHDAPDGTGGYMKVLPENFVNGHLSQDYITGKNTATISAKTEEASAVSQGIFLNYPGVIFKLSPPSPFTATLSSRGNSQSLNYDIPEGSAADGLFAVSFLSFSQVFPPAFREKYELSISSFPNAPQSFSYVVSFFVRRTDADPVSIRVGPPDLVSKIKLGADTQNYILATFTPKIECADCVIEIVIKSLNAQIKKFTELPAVPIPGDTRLSTPKRASGLLVSTQSFPVTPVLLGNQSPEVKVIINIPASVSTVDSWCKGRLDALCTVKYKGSQVPTFFRYVNAVPEEPSTKMLGGVGGVASLSLGGDIEVSLSRGGKVLEKKTVTVNTAPVSPLDQPFLPKWAIDDIRRALFSGAPEFSN